MPEILGAVAAGIAIVTALWKGASAIRRGIRKRKDRQKNTKPVYPVRLTCREANDFHPSSGYHEGLYFEVFNRSDQPVTIKGFGLDIEMHGPDEWRYDQQTQQHPASSFPMRLQPHDGVDGYIDIEALRDEIHARGETQYLTGWRPYVEAIGYGRTFSRVEPQSD